MDEIGLHYKHPEHGELLVKAWVLSKGEVRIHEVYCGGRRCWLRHRKGVYVRHNAEINGEQWMCDLANSGVLNAPLAVECRKWAKRLSKAAAKLTAQNGVQL